MNNKIDKIKKAKIDLIINSPFFGTLVCKLDFKKKDNLNPPTMATDGRHLFYHPDFVEKSSQEEVKGVIVHELLHCALLHMAREGDKNHKLWNIACDYAINPMVIDGDFKLPGKVLISDEFKGLSADDIYKILYDKAEKVPVNYMSIGDVINPGADGGGGGEGNNKESEGKGGSGEYISPAEARQLEQDWKQSVAQAAITAKKACGDIPGDLERFILEELFPKISWSEVLAQFIKGTAKNDYCTSRPNRRFISRNMYLPSLFSNSMGDVVIGVDTSGSIGKEELTQFAAEISAILEEANPENIYVVYCDRRVNNVQEFQVYDLPLTLEPKGGGGTAFSPVFNYVNEKGIQPECLVYLTDMCCSDFGPMPNYPVMWVSTYSNYDEPPFGQVIEIEV